MAVWTVDQHQHGAVDSDGHIDTAGVLDTWHPENLRVRWEMDGGLVVGTFSFELPRTYAFAGGTSPGPSVHDVLLYRGTAVIMEGEITAVDQESLEAEHITIGCEDWWHYFKCRVWPYDATLSYGANNYWPTGFVFRVIAGGEIGALVTDIVNTVRDVSPAWPVASSAGTPSYSLPVTVDADDTGQDIHYYIDAFDSATIYEMVQSLSDLERDQGGFEAYFTRKTLRLAYPEIGDELTPILTLDATNITDLTFRNTGPKATHVLGVGAGTSTGQGGVNRHFAANSATFRRKDIIEDFGDVRDLTAIESMTGQALSWDANPVHEITVTINPNATDASGALLFPGFWDWITTSHLVGQYVHLGPINLGWRTLDSVCKIVSVDADITDERNEEVVLGLNQWYPTSGASGLDEF